MSGLLIWDPLGCLGWIVMALIEPWTQFEPWTQLGKKEQKRLDESPALGHEAYHRPSGQWLSCDGIDMVIKNLDLEPKDIVAEFYGPSWWKELSKESGSKILPCGDGSCWKTFKPIASLIA
ncbi:hypothetical protein Tco_0570263 [Tanacetum coccineum]